MESSLNMLASPDAAAAYRAQNEKRKERLGIMWPNVFRFSLFMNRISRSSSSLKSSEPSGQSFSSTRVWWTHFCIPFPDAHLAHPASVMERAVVRIWGRLLLSLYHWMGGRHCSNFRKKLRGSCPHNRLFAKPATYYVPRNVNSTLNPNSSRII